MEDIVQAGRSHDFGLEAGSKPELLIALALMDNPKGLIICNGFKDRDYLEVALLEYRQNKGPFFINEASIQRFITVQNELKR